MLIKTKNTIEKLYVIGNGFDLDHKLKTSSAHFCIYLKDNTKGLYEFLDTYFYLNTNDDGLWADFENDKPIETPEGKRHRQQQQANKLQMKMDF